MSNILNDEYTLHFAELPIDEDIQQFKFKHFRELRKKVFDLLNPKTNDRIYLYTIDGQRTPILIHENPRHIIDSMNGLMLGEIELMEERHFFIQEYETYEDAFKVALDMHEPNELCYENNKLANSKQD